MAGPIKKKRLGEVLEEEGIITSTQLREALDKQKISGKSLGATLVDLQLLTEEALYQFLAIIRGVGGDHLKDSQGRVTSHLSGLFYRNINLMEMGIKLVYVFDGNNYIFDKNAK